MQRPLSRRWPVRSPGEGQLAVNVLQVKVPYRYCGDLTLQYLTVRLSGLVSGHTVWECC